jgi:5-methylcytosine-specific restriction endonuclease McrA
VQRSEATYDHVVPRAHGGKTTWENIVIACVPCNQRKGGRTPTQAGMRLRTPPVRPKKLPELLSVTFTFQPGMPDSWRTWLRDIAYWNAELEE